MNRALCKISSRLHENACISRNKHVHNTWNRWTHSLNKEKKDESGRTITVYKDFLKNHHYYYYQIIVM